MLDQQPEHSILIKCCELYIHTTFLQQLDLLDADIYNAEFTGWLAHFVSEAAREIKQDAILMVFLWHHLWLMRPAFWKSNSATFVMQKRFFHSLIRDRLAHVFHIFTTLFQLSIMQLIQLLSNSIAPVAISFFQFYPNWCKIVSCPSKVLFKCVF